MSSEKMRRKIRGEMRRSLNIEKRIAKSTAYRPRFFYAESYRNEGNFVIDPIRFEAFIQYDYPARPLRFAAYPCCPGAPSFLPFTR